MLAAESDDLWIGRMIAGLEPKHHLRTVALQVVKQSSLFRARPQDEDFPAWGKGLCDLLQKFRVFLDATSAYGISLVMEMRGRQMRMNDAWADPGQPHRKDLGRQMIDPDHGATVDLILRFYCAAHVGSFPRF